MAIKRNFNQICPNLSQQTSVKDSVVSSYFMKVTLYLQQEKRIVESGTWLGDLIQGKVSYALIVFQRLKIFNKNIPRFGQNHSLCRIPFRVVTLLQRFI